MVLTLDWTNNSGGTFPTDPRITPISVNSNCLIDTGSSNSFWTESGTPDKGGTYRLYEGDAISSPASRHFNPLRLAKSYAVSWSQDVSATRTLHMAIVNEVDGTSTLGNCNAGIDLWIRSNGRVVIREKTAGGSWVSLHDVTESTSLTAAVLTVAPYAYTSGTGLAASQWELEVYSGGTLLNSYTGTHNLTLVTWDAPTANAADPGEAKAHIHFEVNDSGGTDSFDLETFSVNNVDIDYCNDTVWGPVIDGMDLELPDLPDQTKLAWGKIDVSEAPFSCDITGDTDSTVVDANTSALRECMEWAKDYGMDVYFPAGATVVVNDGFQVPQYVFQRTNKSASNRRTFVDEFRPVRLVGSNQGVKPILKLADGSTGFDDGTSISTTKILLDFNVADYAAIPPTVTYPSGIGVLNASYNQGINWLTVDLGDNPGAIGVSGQGAQGTEFIGLDITGTDYFAGCKNLPGSGGAKTTGSVTGGKYGFFVNASQPGPTISGWEFSGQTAAALYGQSTGNRQNMQVIGCSFAMGTGLTAIDWDDVGNQPETGQVSARDCKFTWSVANAGNKAIAAERSLVIKNCFFQNCAEIVEHTNVTDIASPNTTGWAHVEEIVIPDDPPSKAFSYVTPSPFQIDAANWIDGVRSTAVIEAYGPNDIAAPATLITQHQIADAEYLTFEDVTIDVVDDHSGVPDGVTNNSTALNAAISAASPGDVIGLQRGYWITADTLAIPAGVHIVGAGKQQCFVLPTRQPSAGSPFGSSDSPRPVMRLADSTTQTILNEFGFWVHPECPKAYAINVRGNYLLYSIHFQRRSLWGYGSYSGSPSTVNHTWPFVLYTGTNTGGRWYTPNIGNANNTDDGFAFYGWQDTSGNTGIDKQYGPDAEHMHCYFGHWYFDNAGSVHIYNAKTETNWWALYADQCDELIVTGVTGNPSAYIKTGDFSTYWTDRGTWVASQSYAVGNAVTDAGEQYYCITAHVSATGNRPSTGGAQWMLFEDRGLNPEPAEWDSAYDPSLVLLKDVTSFAIYQTQDQVRVSGGHPTFGQGTAVDKWHYGAEVISSTQTLLPKGDRPTAWKRGDPDAPRLTSPSGVVTTSTILASVDTDKISGTIYAVVVPNGDRPTAAQIEAGLQSNNTAAIDTDFSALSGFGTHTFTLFEDLSDGTGYTVAFAHRDSAGSISDPAYVDVTTYEVVEITMTTPNVSIAPFDMDVMLLPAGNISLTMTTPNVSISGVPWTVTPKAIITMTTPNVDISPIDFTVDATQQGAARFARIVFKMDIPTIFFRETQ